MGEKGLNSYQLKWIAIVTMFIDHVGVVLFPQYRILRGIGRISFPIFCFLLVEGFHYTHDRKKYMQRLLLFAVISEIPFNLAVFGSCFAPQHQNVFFTLALGLWMMDVLENTHGMECFGMTVGIIAAAALLRTDYSTKGLFIILTFYLFYEHRMAAALLVGGYELILGYFSPASLQWAAALAMIPILCCNKKQGRKMKYFFYLFYPVHLLILWGITLIR